MCRNPTGRQSPQCRVVALPPLCTVRFLLGEQQLGVQGGPCQAGECSNIAVVAVAVAVVECAVEETDDASNVRYFER